MKLFKRLKIWQAILIVIGVVLLAGAGAFLYVYLTTGFESKAVYPEEIAFVIDEDATEYNMDNAQYEIANDFDLTINTSTADVNVKKLTLSFTINYTDREIEGRSGYITDGTITIPHFVEVGKPFTVEVNKKEEAGVLVNVGGVSTIYAKTDDKTKLPISTKVAIDVPVYSTTTQVKYKESGAEVTKDENEFRVTEKNDVVLTTGFFPTNSQYIYSDNSPKSAVTNRREKLSYLEIIEGNGNFVMTKQDDEIYFSAVGELGSKSKVRIYTFKNGADQIKFYEGFTPDTQSEQIYNAAIQYLSSNPALAVIEDVEMVIVQANVKDFRLTGVDNLSLMINKQYSLVADKSNPSDLTRFNLSISVVDSASDGTSGNKLISMLKNVAVRPVKKIGDVYVPTTDVKIVGLNAVNLKDDERVFTFINSNVKDLTNSYFEVSSRKIGEYYLEFALMLRELNTTEEVYYIFGDEEEKIERIKINFNEPQELNVGWTDPSLEINMVVYSGASSTQYPTDLVDLVSIPTSNQYKKLVFFADFGDLSEEEIRNYMDFKSYREYTVGKLIELNSSDLMVKKGIEFGLRFAVVKTDAYGNDILLDDGSYDVSQWSSRVQVNAVETISSLQDLVSVDIDEKYTNGDGNYIIPVEKGQFNLVVDFDEDELNAELMASQLERFDVVVYDEENEEYLQGLVNVLTKERVENSNKFEFALTFKRENLFASDKVVKLALVYKTPIRDIIEIAKSHEKTITVYFGDAVSFDMGDIITKTDGSYLAKKDISTEIIKLEEQIDGGQEITVEEFNEMIASIQAKDKFGKVIEDAEISVSSNNTNFISVVNNEIIVNNVNGGSCTLAIYCGNATAFVVINAGTLNITKVEYKDGGNWTESESISNVTVQILGNKENVITLEELVRIYVDGTVIDPTNYYFTLPTYNAMANKELIFGGVLSYVTQDSEELSPNAKIISLSVDEDIAQDLTLPLNIIGTNSAINITLNLVISSNIASDSVNFSGVTKPEDEDGKIGVYAQYEMDLDEILLVTLTDGTFDWSEVSYEEEGFIVCNGKLVFDEVFEKTELEITIYKLNQNPYAYSKTIRFVVYPNFKIDILNNVVDLTALVGATDEKKPLSEFFEIKRFAGTKTLPTLNCEVVGNAPIAINGKNFQRNGLLVLGYGETAKAFSVRVLSGDKIIKDYQNEDALLDFNLDFGIPYCDIATPNDWMKVVNYNNNQMIMIKENGSTPYEFEWNSNVVVGLKFGSIYNVSEINITSDTTMLVNLTSSDPAILMGLKYYLPIEMIKNNTRIATIQIPVIISAFDIATIFAKYNEFANIDLKDLLTQDYESMEIYATTFTAGAETQIVYDATSGSNEGIYGTATIVVEVQENVVSDGTALASIDENKLVLKNLAGDEDVYVILKVTQTENGHSLVYYYRVKVSPNTGVETKYPNESMDKEYLIIDQTNYQVDLANKFEINLQENTSTNKIKEIEINGTVYTVGGTNPIIKNQDTYTVNGFITISFDGDNDDEMTINILDYSKSIRLVVTKIYGDVVNGSADYTFAINSSNYKYVMDMSATTGSYDDGVWTANPAGTTTLSAVTKQTNRISGGAQTEVDTDSVKTSASFTYMGTGTATVDGNELKITDVATITYNYVNKTVTITATAVTTEHRIAVDFSVLVYDGDEIVAGQTNIAHLEIVIPSTVRIEETTTDIYGGTTIGVDNLISNIQKFNGSTYTDATLYEANITQKPDFIDGSGKISMLKEDKTAEFEVTITIDGIDYKFNLTRTIKKNVTYKDGSDLKVDMQSAYVYNYEQVYYAGQNAEVTIDKYLSFVTGTGINDGTFTASALSISGVSILNPDIIDGEGKISLITDNVSTDISITVPVLVTYTFNTQSYTFYVNIRLLIKPNVVASVNYPNPTGSEVLAYETIGTGNGNSVTLTDYLGSNEPKTLQYFFTAKTAPLADGNRVTFANAGDNEEIDYSNDTLADCLVSVKSATNIDSEKLRQSGNKTITLSSDIPGEVVYTIQYNKVSIDYTIYVVKGDIYQANINRNINFKTTQNETYEVIYKDSLNGNYNIFENDRLVKLSFKDSVGATYNGTVMYVEFVNSENSKHVVTFKYKTDYDNSTIHLEAGKSLSDYEFSRIYYINNSSVQVDLDICKTTPTTTERVYATYRTKLGYVEVPNATNNKVNTSVENTDAKVTCTLTSGSGSLSASIDYKYKLDVDIAVEKTVDENYYLVINATDLSSPNNLINIAQITKPSSGLALSQADFEANNTITTSLSVFNDFNISGQDFNDYVEQGYTYDSEQNKFIKDEEIPIALTQAQKVYWTFRNAHPEFEDAFQVSQNTIGERPLTWTEYEVSATDHRAYNYFLFGEGAYNKGTFVMLKYTYTVSGFSKTFYIMIQILPDYQVTIDGVIATRMVDGASVSNNLLNPIEVAWDSTLNNNAGAYSIQLVSKTANIDDKVSIIKTNSASPVNNAASWTYAMTANDTDGETVKTYNTDMSKLEYNGSTLLEDDGSTLSSSQWTWNKEENLVLTNSTENFFGTKFYKIEATNVYGYKADIYFKFLPTNNQEPTISSSSMTEITEGDKFDIGAIYERLTVEENVGQYGAFNETTLKFTINGTTSVTDNANNTATLSPSGTPGEYTGTLDTKTITVTYNMSGNNPIPQLLTYNGDTYKKDPSEATDKTIKKLYTLTATQTIPSSSSTKLINIAGINAWGFVNLPEGIIASQITNGGDYVEADKMTLQYVTVTGIEFRYSNLEVGKMSPLPNKLATASGLTMFGVDSNSYRSIGTTFTMPKLESWIYSDSASITSGQNNPLTDTASVTAIITLKYSSNSNMETYQVSLPLRVSRKLEIQKTVSETNEAVVRDGVEFTLNPDSGLSYIKPVLGSGESTPILDDTLVVTLPANPGSQPQRLTISATVKSGNTEKAKFEDYTIENSLARPQTFYISISKLLKQSNGKGYILESGNTITFSFTGYESNSDYKYYATYNHDSVENKVTVGQIKSKQGTESEENNGKDVINIEHADLFLENNGIKSVIKSYVVVYDGKSYRVEKEYLVTPVVYNSDMDPEGLNPIAYSSYDGNKYTYTVNLSDWAGNINLTGLSGLNIGSTSTAGSYTFSGVGADKFKFRIGGETVSGTATIDNNGMITTRAGYQLGGQEYIHVYVYVKASGYDGGYSVENGNDHFIGSIRIIVTDSQ